MRHKGIVGSFGLRGFFWQKPCVMYEGWRVFTTWTRKVDTIQIHCGCRMFWVHRSEWVILFFFLNLSLSSHQSLQLTWLLVLSHNNFLFHNVCVTLLNVSSIKMSQNNLKSPCRAEGDISVLLVLSTNSPKSHKYKSYMIKKKKQLQWRFQIQKGCK